MDKIIKPEDIENTDLAGYTQIFVAAPGSGGPHHLIYTPPMLTTMYASNTEAKTLDIKNLIIEVDDPADPEIRRKILGQYLEARKG